MQQLRRLVSSAVSIALCCLLTGFAGVGIARAAGREPTGAVNRPFLVLRLALPAATCKCIAAAVAPTASTYSPGGGVICVSVMWNNGDPEHGLCNIGENCAGVTPRPCKVPFEFTLMVADTPNPPCNFGAQVTSGKNKPNGIVLPGFSAAWTATLESPCHGNGSETREDYAIKDAGGNLLFTFNPGVNCGECDT